MITKFKTGDIVYAPVKIISAEEYTGKIHYRVRYPNGEEFIPQLLPEEIIKSDVVAKSVRIHPDTSEIDEVTKKMKDLTEAIEKAKSLLDELAFRKEVMISCSTGSMGQ